MANKGKLLCDDAMKIKKILEKGYYIAEWINTTGIKQYYLVEKGKKPWEGAHLSTKMQECPMGKLYKD